MPKISIVILTYNSSAHILDLLRSIENSQRNISDIEIVVVDNASDDDTLEKVKHSKLNIKIRELPKNIGFAAGINAGVQNTTGEYLLFLNPDTKIEKGDFLEMVELFEESRVGVVGGKMLNGKNPEKSAGKELNLTSTLALIFGMDEKLGFRYSPEKEQEVGFVSGGFMLVRKKLFMDLKGFDEDFFMYVEDADFCFRAKEKGFKNIFTPDYVVQHKSHGSSNREFAILNICKGLILYHSKHSPGYVQIVVKFLLKTKAALLVLIGKLMNNKYLADAYIDVARL